MHSFKDFVTVREDASTPVHQGVKVHGIHFSNKANLTSLDGRYSGSGIKGAEGQRLALAKDQRIKTRVYFYNKEPYHKGPLVPQHEQGLGQHAYEAHLTNIYDHEKAKPESRKAVVATWEHHEKNGEETGNAFERAVVDHGYNGYTNRGMTVVLNHHDQPVSYLGQRHELLRR